MSLWDLLTLKIFFQENKIRYIGFKKGLNATLTAEKQKLRKTKITQKTKQKKTNSLQDLQKSQETDQLNQIEKRKQRTINQHKSRIKQKIKNISTKVVRSINSRYKNHNKTLNPV